MSSEDRVKLVVKAIDVAMVVFVVVMGDPGLRQTAELYARKIVKTLKPPAKVPSPAEVSAMLAEAERVKDEGVIGGG